MQCQGLVAPGPAAMARVACDTGFLIEVSLEYLPMALLECSWTGESPT